MNRRGGTVSWGFRAEWASPGEGDFVFLSGSLRSLSLSGIERKIVTVYLYVLDKRE